MQHCSIAALHSYNIYKTSLERKKNHLVSLFLATNILQWKKLGWVLCWIGEFFTMQSLQKGGYF